MARRNKKGLRLIDIIIFIIAIVIIIAIVANINKKKTNNTEENKTVNQSEQIQKVEEKNVIELEDGTKLNVSSKLNESKALGDLAIKNIQLTYKDGVTNLLCNIKNTSNKKTNIQNVDIILQDETGKTIYSMQGIIEEIEVGETKEFNTSITADFANAYDFKIVKK